VAQLNEWDFPPTFGGSVGAVPDQTIRNMIDELHCCGPSIEASPCNLHHPTSSRSLHASLGRVRRNSVNKLLIRSCLFARGHCLGLLASSCDEGARSRVIRLPCQTIPARPKDLFRYGHRCRSVIINAQITASTTKVLGCKAMMSYRGAV
jgi:hypothetical protein